MPAPLEEVPDRLKDAFDQAIGYISAAQAETTKRGYLSDWRGFLSWCQAHQTDPFTLGPPEPLVALYIAAQAHHLAATTISRHVRAIAATYRAHGRDFNPRHELLAAVLRGIHRHHGKAAEGKQALPMEELVGILSLLGDSLHDLRDRALILIGFFGAFRRSELAAIHYHHLDFAPGGLTIQLTGSKTDPLHHGQVKALPYQPLSALCPVQAVKDWLTSSQISQGPLFRRIRRYGVVGSSPLRGRSIARLIKQRYRTYLQTLGLSEEVLIARLDRISSHSLRSGFITHAFRQGEKQWRIRKLTGHLSDQRLEEYNRPENIFSNYPAPLSPGTYEVMGDPKVRH